jgi:hypothetical protein
MIHVQEKTKKKIFKEQGFLQTTTKDPIPFKGNPFPVVITKKDCLTIDIGSHVLLFHFFSKNFSQRFQNNVPGV